MNTALDALRYLLLVVAVLSAFIVPSMVFSTSHHIVVLSEPTSEQMAAVEGATLTDGLWLDDIAELGDGDYVAKLVTREKQRHMVVEFLDSLGLTYMVVVSGSAYPLEWHRPSNSFWDTGFLRGFTYADALGPFGNSTDVYYVRP